MQKLRLVSTVRFDNWFNKLKDRDLKSQIEARLRRLAMGYGGDCKFVGGGISELRFHKGAGYRIYWKPYKSVIILLLCGGDKDTQNRDIEYAKDYAKQWEADNGKD